MVDTRKKDTNKKQNFLGSRLKTLAKVSLASIALIFGGSKKAEASGSPMRNGVQRAPTTIVQQTPVEYVEPVTHVAQIDPCTPQVEPLARSEPVSVRGMTPAPALTRRVRSTAEWSSCGGGRVVSTPTVRYSRPSSTAGTRTGGGGHRTSMTTHSASHSVHRGSMMERHVGHSAPRVGGRSHGGPAMAPRGPRGGHPGMRNFPHGGYHNPKVPRGGRKIRPQRKGRSF